MKSFVVLLTLLILAAAGPLAAAVDCGGCWGSLLCPAPPPCPKNATHVTGGGTGVLQVAINKAKTGAVICVGPGIYKGNINFGGKALTLKASPPLSATLQGTGSATLEADASPAGTALLNNFNLFFHNTGGDSQNTTGNLGILTSDPLFGSCYALNPGSPALHTGLPDLHFDNSNNTPNNMGIRGGPAVP